MDSTIETSFAKKYGPQLYILSMQRMSKLASRCRRETVKGAKEAYYDRLGEVESQEITTRHGDTPLNEAPHTKRRVALTSIDTNTPLDHLDKLQMMIDPQSAYGTVQARKLGKDTDDKIIAAALGTAYCGEEGTTAVTFQSESISINGDGTATTLGTLAAVGAIADISLAKMLLMAQIFDDADVDELIPRHWAVRPKDIYDMLDITEVGSSDFNTVKALVNGKPGEFMGFNWVKSNRITKDAATETGYRSIAWAQDGIILASWEDVFNRVDERADKRYMIQVYSRMTLGAVRLEGVKVHECLNKVA